MGHVPKNQTMSFYQSSSVYKNRAGRWRESFFVTPSKLLFPSLCDFRQCQL